MKNVNFSTLDQLCAVLLEISPTSVHLIVTLCIMTIPFHDLQVYLASFFKYVPTLCMSRIIGRN